MRVLYSFSFLSTVSLLSATFAAGCMPGAGHSDPDPGAGGKADTAFEVEDGQFEHRWAIDMAEVRSVGKYASSKRFVAATVEELFGQPLENLPPEVQQLAQAACEKERVLDDAGHVVEESPHAECLYYGNTQRVDYDHTWHDEENVRQAAIVDYDRDGRPVWIDPPGYLNLIAMYNTDPENQREIRENLQNGDILVYFHPEDPDTTQYRAHHGAMYYETSEGPLALSLDTDKPYVHHIDNPMSYGPSFADGKGTTPFHVFRFNPNGAPLAGGVRDEEGRFKFPCNDAAAQWFDQCRSGGEHFTISDEMAVQYAYMARNWALITNGHTPFASFHDLSWRDRHQRAQDGLTDGLGVLAEVDRFAGPAMARNQDAMPGVYCKGLVYTNLNLALNRPLNETSLAGAEGGGLWENFQDKTYQFDDRYFSQELDAGLLTHPSTDALRPLGQLVFEPITASDIVDAWVDGYYRFPGMPQAVADQARARIIGGAADRIASGFYQVTWADRWSDAKTAAAEAAGEEAPMVVTPEVVQAYAGAFAGRAGATGERPSECRAEEPATWSYDCMKALERERVENRYVPPFLAHYLANRPESVLSYVGTVIHRDLLRPLPGVEVDDELAQPSGVRKGGPDSSLYEHYGVPNGGRHVQRILEVSSGPQRVGYGSKIATRISAADIRDVRVVLHPPGTFPESPDLYRCETDATCIGEAPEGIAVPLSPGMAGGDTTWDDVTITFDLFAPVEEGGLGCLMDEGPVCPAYDWESGESWGNVRIDRAWGQWTLTVLDRGDKGDGTAIENCAECATGGAHTNQWVLIVRDDEESEDDGWEDEDFDHENDTLWDSVVAEEFSEEGGALVDATENDLGPWCGENVRGVGETTATLSFDLPANAVGASFYFTIEHHWHPDIWVGLRHNGQEFPLVQCQSGRGTLYNAGSLDPRELAPEDPNGTWELVVRDYDKDSNPERGADNRIRMFELFYGVPRN